MKPCDTQWNRQSWEVCKGNHTIKSGQLIEYNMRNVFLEKLYTKCDGETSWNGYNKILG